MDVAIQRMRIQQKSRQLRMMAMAMAMAMAMEKPTLSHQYHLIILLTHQIITKLSYLPELTLFRQTRQTYPNHQPIN